MADEDPDPGLSEYEKQRLARIAANKVTFRALGLDQASTAVGSAAKKEHKAGGRREAANRDVVAKQPAAGRSRNSKRKAADALPPDAYIGGPDAVPTRKMKKRRVRPRCTLEMSPPVYSHRHEAAEKLLLLCMCVYACVCVCVCVCVCACVCLCVCVCVSVFECVCAARRRRACPC